MILIDTQKEEFTKLKDIRIFEKMDNEQRYNGDLLVIGLGGIMNGEDALEFILAGATAVEVGTANFINPRVTIEIIDYIKEYMQRHHISDIRELIGAVNR